MIAACRVLSLVLLAVAGCTQPAPGGYDFSRSQAEAVRAFLDANPGVRILTASDNVSPMLADQQESEPDYEPYFASGDFDGDGEEDFVVAAGEGESFALFLFRASGTGYLPASSFVGMGWLPEVGLFVREDDRGSGEIIGVGSFFSDDAIWFGWSEEVQDLQVLHLDTEE